MKSVVLPFLAALPLLVAAQTPSGDYGFHTNQLWWPAALTAVGAIGAAGTFHQDYPDDHWLTPHTGTGVDDVLRFVPSATYVGLAFTKFDEIMDYIKSHSVLTEEDKELGIR